jgi:hypothetical protein
MAGMEGLGRLFDIGLAVAPVDINTSDAATGKYIDMSNATGVTIVAVTLAGGADDLTFDVQQHTQKTSAGTNADLDATGVATSQGIDHYYIKAETTLDNDEAWVKVTQTAASECTVVGATYGTQQKLVAIYVSADQLGDGYRWLSVDVACTTSTSQLLAVLYIKHDLASQRGPANLPNLLSAGTANA